MNSTVNFRQSTEAVIVSASCRVSRIELCRFQLDTTSTEAWCTVPAKRTAEKRSVCQLARKGSELSPITAMQWRLQS